MNSKPKLLQNRGFAKLIFSNATGRFADSLDAITFSWLMFLVSENAAMIALIFAVNYVPTILLQPFTGVLADRYSKKLIVALCDFGRAILALCTLLLFRSQALLPWMLFPLTLAVSTLEAFRIPAGSALIPELLPKEQIKAGNALNLTLRRICEAVGTAAAGILIATADCSAALAVDALLFALSGVLAFAIASPKATAQRSNAKPSVLKEFTQGMIYLRGKKRVIFVVFMSAALNFLSVPYSALQSIFFGETLRFSVDTLTYCNTAMLIGASVGAMIMAKCKGKWVKERFAQTTCLLLGFYIPFYLGLSFANQITSDLLRFIVVLSLYLICGLVMGFFAVLTGSKLMEEVEISYVGRISGVANAIGLSMVPISSLLCSTLSIGLNVAGVYLVIAGFAAILVATSGMILRRATLTDKN